MSALAELKKHYRDDSAAREWKANGGQVIGYIGPDVPEELLLAAGVFPIRVTGDPFGSTAIGDKYFPPTYHPVARSILNRLLDGTYAFLDHVIIANSTEHILRVFYYLREIKRLEPYPGMPPFSFFEFLHTHFRTSALYNRDRVRELQARLEAWTGNEITDQALGQAIAVCNENRRLLHQVAELRTQPAPRLSGSDALQVIGSARFMPKSDHNRLLRELLQGAEQLPARSGARLFVEGTSLDSSWFHELVESNGATIVGEDSDWGNRAFDTLVDESASPVDAIVDRYHFMAPDPHKSTVQERVDYLVRKAVETQAQGVIFFMLSGEDPVWWDYPEQKQALEARGIATLCLGRQPYAPADTHALADQLQSFVGSLAPG